MRYSEEITDSYYEDSSIEFLSRISPAVIQITGEDYDEFTEKFQKPYDELFIKAMQDTLKYLCSHIPGCVFGYTKKFDITLIVKAGNDIEKKTCFNMDVQKIITIVSSMATLIFNRRFEALAKAYVMGGHNFDKTYKLSAMQGYVSSIDKGAFFTTKCFNISTEHIFSYIHLQQKNCLEKGIEEMAALHLDRAEYEGMSPAQIQFLVFEKKGINFDNYPAYFKRGSVCLPNNADPDKLIKEDEQDDAWVIDPDMPVFKDENRNYIERLL